MTQFDLLRSCAVIALACVTNQALANQAVTNPAPAKGPHPVEAAIGPLLGNPADAPAIQAWCDRLAGEIDHRVKSLEAETGPATVAITLQAFDDIYNLAASGLGEAGLYREVMADAPRRDAGAACEVRMQTELNHLTLSRPAYDRLKAIDASHSDAATRYYLKRLLLGFETAGVSLPAEQRAKASTLQDRISQNGTAFEKGIADARATFEADPAQLKGLPADFIAAHPVGANGKVTLSTDYTDQYPVMSYAQDDDLRRSMTKASRTRGYPQNDVPLTAMLDDRAALAALLGRPDYASVVLADKMLDTPAKVEDLLGGLDAVARPVAKKDYDRLLAERQRTDPAAKVMELWQYNFYSKQIEQRDYAYNAQDVRQYLSYGKVRDGILKLTTDLFGVQIRPWKTPVWDPAVEAYEMLEGGKVIGAFYFDSHPRPGKYEHANMIGLRIGLEGRSVPVGALVTNLSAGTDPDALVEHEDLVTFLHEFGHMLHHIFGGQAQRWAGQSGVANEWDFVEAPSQMLEQWAYDYDTLASFATNAQGQAIPRELVEKMNRARYFGKGLDVIKGIGLSQVSLKLHEAPAPKDPGAATRAIYQRYNFGPLPDWYELQDSFSHLNGYSAIYYTYTWSEAIADDLFTRFETHGMRDRATAQRYREMVLAPGGSRPAAELVENFLERPISLDAFKAELGKDK